MRRTGDREINNEKIIIGLEIKQHRHQGKENYMANNDRDDEK